MVDEITSPAAQDAYDLGRKLADGREEILAPYETTLVDASSNYLRLFDLFRGRRLHRLMAYTRTVSAALFGRIQAALTLTNRCTYIPMYSR